MIHPEQTDIGRQIIYREHGDHAGRIVEAGVLTSFNGSYAFVRYGDQAKSKATEFRDLVWPIRVYSDHQSWRQTN